MDYASGMLSVGFVFILMIVFKFKHFIADYPLQGTFMLGKFLPGWDFVLPLTAHCAVHAAFTFTIAMFVNPHLAVTCAALDFVIHFVMDRIKASPNMLGKYKNFSANEYGFIKMGFEPAKMDHIQFQNSSCAKFSCNTINKERVKTLMLHNRLFWIFIGVDQLVHGLTDILIMYILLMG